MERPRPRCLLDLPSEVLQYILAHLSTPAFLTTTVTCRKLMELASSSRGVVLKHLQNVPGIKLGLEDHWVSTSDLFLILRQRAAAHLYGVNFTADCRDYRFSAGRLDSSASCLVASTDYINISLVLRQDLTIRLYGGRCQCKEVIESPYADGIGKIIQVVHHKNFISILYSWAPDETEPWSPSVVDESGFKARSERPTVDCVPAVDSEEKKTFNRPAKYTPIEEASTAAAGIKYHLIHYNAYNSDRPTFFTIRPPKTLKPLVPVHLAVYNRLQVAIIWDRPNCKLMPTPYTKVIHYRTDRLPHNTEGWYTSYSLYPPTPNKQSSATAGPDMVKAFAPKPRSAAFCRDGRRLRLYAPGSVVPFAISTTPISAATNSTMESQNSANEVTARYSRMFKAEMAFFGTHETIMTVEENALQECTLINLFLGTTKTGPSDGKGNSTGPSVLCILQSWDKVVYNDCMHLVERDVLPTDDSSIRVVARLWGWTESTTTITGLDRVCISKKGTRIAIAMWDRILVWSLEPKVFCEQWDDQELEEDVAYSLAKRELRATRFYELVNDDELGGEIVVLRPVVLMLGKDVVARKMIWSSRDAVDEVDLDASSEADSESSGSGSDTNTEDADEDEDANLDEYHIGQHPPFESTPPITLPIRSKDEDYFRSISTTAWDTTDEKDKPPMPAVPTASTDDLLASTADSTILPPAPTPPAPDPQPRSSSSIANLHAHSHLHSHTTSRSKAQAKATAKSTSKHKEKEKEKEKKRKRKIRKGEDELVVLTDQGVQMWDLSVWGKGRRIRRSL